MNVSIAPARLAMSLPVATVSLALLASLSGCSNCDGVLGRVQCREDSDCESGQICVVRACVDGCRIDEEVFYGGRVHPDVACLICDPVDSVYEWSDICPPGQYCDRDEGRCAELPREIRAGSITGGATVRMSSDSHHVDAVLAPPEGGVGDGSRSIESPGYSLVPGVLP